MFFCFESWCEVVYMYTSDPINNQPVLSLSSSLPLQVTEELVRSSRFLWQTLWTYTWLKSIYFSIPSFLYFAIINPIFATHQQYSGRERVPLPPAKHCWLHHDSCDLSYYNFPPPVCSQGAGYKEVVMTSWYPDASDLLHDLTQG